MSKFLNYNNRISNNSRIFSMDELLKMSLGEFIDRENELDSQDSLIGLPTSNELKNSPNVKFINSYIDKNGQTIPPKWEAVTIPPGLNQDELIEYLHNNSPQFGTPLPLNNSTNIEELLKRLIALLLGGKNSPSLNNFNPLSSGNNFSKPNFQANELNYENEFDSEIDSLVNSNLYESEPEFQMNMMEQPVQNSSSALSQFAGMFSQLLPLMSNVEGNYQNGTVRELEEKYKNYLLDPKMQQYLVFQENPNNNPVLNNMLLNNNLQNSNSQEENTVVPLLKGHVETSKKEESIRKIFEPFKKFVNILNNNNYEESELQTKWENVQEKFYTKFSKLLFPMATEATKKGMNDLSQNKNEHAIVHKNLDEIKNEELKKELKGYGAKEGMKGVQYDNNSIQAKRIGKSAEMKNYIDAMCKNGGKATSNAINFEFNLWHPIESMDRHASIQHAKIHNAHISEDGNYMEGSIVDVSDFEKRAPNLKNIANNWGYNMQEKGRYTPYFIVVDVKIPLTEEQKEKLRKSKQRY